MVMVDRESKRGGGSERKREMERPMREYQHWFLKREGKRHGANARKREKEVREIDTGGSGGGKERKKE